MSEWISVKDRLPLYGRVLVFTNYGFHYTAFFKPNTRWYEINLADDERITHWMPLPEPPKEGTDHE